MHVEFQYCGSLNKEYRDVAYEIAEYSDNADEAWAALDKLDRDTQNAIYDVGNFLEVE